ncbi:GNAT family N-acetyltransferase [Ruminococcus sp. FC2018]|uniref:GNAT family N-acetyltransferase n=1 Tax=Ruminococcus sp. FC2018 TaxID=1410617 RepID=UPI000686B9C9|nr:GNAT family N-acetyltransferase [Ruminococcus sp. FC2018]
MITEKADLEYIDQLTDLRIAYLTEDHGNLTEEEKERITSSLPDYYKKHLNNDLFVYICRTDSEIVSCCFLLVTEKPANPDFLNGKTGTILNVYTKPEHRHKGYAKKLMEMMLDDARMMELDFVELKATEDGYGLYKKVGFKDAASKYHNMKYVL